MTPKTSGKFTRTAVIEPSHYDPGTAYVAATRYPLDDFAPSLWKTTDYGKTWTPINTGVPVGAYTRTIREDPVRRGLLYAGTEIGVFISLDDGAHLGGAPTQLAPGQRPRLGRAWRGPHCRDPRAGLLALDNISSLRQLADSVTTKKADLFRPATAMRWFSGVNPRSLTAGQNPMSGAAVDYWLKEAPTTKITLEFLDSRATVLRRYTSDSVPADSIGARIRSAMKDSLADWPADSVVSARAGSERFVWDMRYPEAKQLKNIVVDEGTLSGPVIPPGPSGVRLIVGADTLTRPFDVIADPRATSTTAELTAQAQASLHHADDLECPAPNRRLSAEPAARGSHRRPERETRP